MDDAAVGVFDSGVGGLTVVRRIATRLPAEPVIYLGDTARVPYGTKSADTVIRYARACATLLCKRNVKLLVVACNTASAYALDTLREELPIPVLGVIEPGAQRAVQATRNRKVGVIGTVGTVRSGAYQAVVHALDPAIEVLAKPCPLFVPLAEEGWLEGPVPAQVAHAYLDELLAAGIDTLVLGCTHYPLLRSVIAEAAGDAVTIVDSAEATAAVVADTLAAMGLACAPGGPPPRHRFLVTDDPAGFARIGARFLDEGHPARDLAEVEWVDFQ
ncbi:MAG: glutamate racemase [Candidatus Hydrogenedentes bacterium]|nr:glutamate racemase [Candidatus Hydrogenedentota bacterium]